MYPVSEDYLNAIQSNSVQTSYRGLITSKLGIPYTFSGKDIVSGSGSLTRQICNGEDIQIGTTCSAELDISLFLDVDRYQLYESRIQMWFQLTMPNGRIEEVPLGTFYAIEPPERSINILTFHAYDAMYKFDAVPIDATLQGNPYLILQYICNRCQVELGTEQEYIASCPNGLINTYSYKDANLDTYRDLLADLAGYLGCFAYIDVDNKLYLKRYSMVEDRVITSNTRYNFVPTDYVSYYSKITAEFLITKEMESITINSDGLTYDFGANAFAQIDDDDVRKSVLLNIITYLNETKYTPFTAKVPCDPSLMVGDVLKFTDNHADAKDIACITKQVITIGGSMELECTGRDPLTELRTATEKAIAGVSYSKADDTLHYYDFVNTDIIHIVANAKRALLFRVEYITTKSTHVDFHAQVACEIENKEEIAQDFSNVIEYDGIVKITYALADEEVVDFYPVDTFLDGRHLLNLLYSFWASGNQHSTFSVYIECIDCTMDIAIGHARGYMCGQGLVGDEAWDGAVHIYDDFVPRDMSMIRGEFTDSVNISKHIPLGDSITQNKYKWNAMSILKTFTDSIYGNELIHYDVAYKGSVVTLNNAHVVDGSWKSIDSTQLGFVTTANEYVNRILKITSKHSGDDVAYIVSFDGGETWWTYANGWTEPDYTQDVYGMFEGTMRSITASQWNQKLNGQIMVQAILIGSGSTLTDIQIYTAEIADWLTIEPSDVTNYNTRYVVVSEDAVELNYKYEDYTSSAQSIDSGSASVLTVDDSIYSTINEVNVKDENLFTDAQLDLHNWEKPLAGFTPQIAYENERSVVTLTAIGGWEDFVTEVEVEPNTDYLLTFKLDTPTGYRSYNTNESRRAYVWDETWNWPNAQYSLTDYRLLGYSEPWSKTADMNHTEYSVAFNSADNHKVRIDLGFGDVYDGSTATFTFQEFKLVKVE